MGRFGRSVGRRSKRQFIFVASSLNRTLFFHTRQSGCQFHFQPAPSTSLFLPGDGAAWGVVRKNPSHFVLNACRIRWSCQRWWRAYAARQRAEAAVCSRRVSLSSLTHTPTNGHCGGGGWTDGRTDKASLETIFFSNVVSSSLVALQVVDDFSFTRPLPFSVCERSSPL